MNSELKTRWIEALLSGKYEQGIGQLKDNKGRYCCLGVLRDIAGITKNQCRDEMGVIDKLKHEVSRTEQYRLAQMNDNGSSFIQIAQYIEENL